jgi:CRP-like cAMP-binding protein
MRDLTILSSGRPLILLPFEDDWVDTTDGPDVVVLLVSGCALLRIQTRVGPHTIQVLHAPVFLNLQRVFAGTVDVCAFSPEPDSDAIVFTRKEVQDLVFDQGEEGQAFRRLALTSVASILRLTNMSLSRIFAGVLPPSQAGQAQTSAVEDRSQTLAVSFDEREAYILLDAAGIDTSSLPDLGLTAFEVPEETPLITAGSRGDDAFLIGEGRLRVAIRVSGMASEALAFLGPGEIVGEMSLIDDAPRSADVIAHGGPALVYRLSREVFRRLLETGVPEGAPLLAGITLALTKRVDEALRRAVTFRMLAGPG